MSQPSMPARLLALLLGLAAALLGVRAARAADEVEPQTSRWYEQTLDGDKVAWLRVVWAPSTWKGKKTLRDTTTIVSRSERRMGPMTDVFTATTTLELERGEDGTLWWQRIRREEPERVTVEESTWTGDGYDHTVTIRGEEANREHIRVDLEAPVHIDAEAFLGGRARAGELAKGATFELRQLDLRGRGVRLSTLAVQGEESIPDEHGAPTPCIRILERDPATGEESHLWLDAQGALVRLQGGAVRIQRVTEAKASEMPERPAGYSITIPATPPLARIFNADRVLLDVHIRADEHRKLPVFPESPWSRVLLTSGDDEHGHLAKVELRRYDDLAAKARIPVVDKKFARWLEPTALMQTQDPLVQQTVRDVLGEERDARAAAWKLARYVFTTLEKRSGKLAQADAVQILKDCQGDCSEHCLLFVTLCRAAGIPARRCSGYVCIGSMWGAHAWCEIWTGAWIGADPTTGEVGTGARYLFYGYDDEPGSYPGVVSARARGRLRIVATRVEEGAAGFDLVEAGSHRIRDRAGRRYAHVLAGIEARDVPKDWSVQMSGDNLMLLRGPGFTAQVGAWADQGESMETIGRYFRGERGTFAGVPALVRASGYSRMYWLFNRRRRVQVVFGGRNDEALAVLERVLAATFAEPAPAWDPPAAPGAGPGPKDGK